MFTKILSFIFYVIVICPLALLFKLINKDPLRLKLDHSAKTYWENV